MSLILSAELAAACNALGSYDAKTNSYYGDDNTLETVKDLIRYLRRDTESHEVRRHFGAAKILQVNLIPLLKLYWQQTDLFDVLLRLLGNLTSPVLLLYNEEIPKEKVVRNHFLQILGHLQSYKEAFADYDLWAVLCTRLSQLLNVEWQERGEENSLIIERILILVRNVLNVPADPDAEKRPDNDVSAHDKVLWSLRKSGLVDIILYMVSSEQEESYYMYLLEILSLMLREHRPADLANVAITRSQSEKTQDEAEFLAVRRQEMDRKNERIRSFTSARHSRFGGTFVVKNLKSVNDSQELIYHKSLNKANVLDFDADKSKVKVPKNRQPLQESSSFRRSTFSIRLLLKDFCVEFLNAGYNRLMHNVRGKLLRGKSASHDETYYLWALRFFMEFNRLHKTDVKLVSETMSNEIFHYVQQQMEHNFDMITSDKKKWPLWSKRLHLALQAYKELLLNLISMDKSSDESIRESTRVIKGNVFYVLEYREFILTLMLTYSPLKMSHAYLLDLIETQHIFLKMLQGYCGRENSVVVQRKQKAKRTTKKKKQQVAAAPQISVEEYLQNKWDELAPQLTTVLEGGENIPEIPPFDASSDIPIDEQKKDAMIRIQNYLRDDEIENSIGLLRSAREVWPENDSFGSTGMAPEEEFMAIREIFFAELQDRNPIATQHQTTVNDEEEEEEEEDEEEDELHDGQDAPAEVDFKFQDFVSRFVNPKVVQACGLALRHFDANPVTMNHFILKLLHRIAWDCKMPTMVFQASIFRSFQRIFKERHRPQHKELVKFAIFIVRQFVKVTEKNKKVFMELLFWKNSREAYDIEEGYGSYQQKSQAMKAVWSEEEEEELRVLVMEHKQKEIDEDPIDWILSNLIDNTKTRRMVIKKLKQMMLLDYKGPKKTSRVPTEWQEHEVMQLTELFNQFREASDPMGCILDRLDVKRPRPRIVLKLLELGLIQDAKEIRKKRISKADRQLQEGITSRENIDSDDDVHSSEDENSENIERSSVSNNMAGSSSQKARKPSKPSNKKAGKPRQVDVKITKKLLLDVTNKGMSNSLKWIVENMTDTAEELEKESDIDNDEGVPLVPIGEEDILAMDNALFKRTLTALGIQKPGNEQEIYWRIPGYMTADDLQRTCSIINDILENGAAAIEEEPAPIPSSTSAAGAESSDEDVFDRLRNFISKPDSASLIPEESVTQESNTRETLTEPNSIKKNGRKGRVAVESDDSEEETNTPNTESNNDDVISDSQVTNTNNESQKEIKNKKNKKTKRVQIQDDSDESDVEANKENEELTETEIENTANDSISRKGRRRVNVLEESDESDKEETTDAGSVSKRARGSDSDSDSNKQSVKRKRVVIDSDDE